MHDPFGENKMGAERICRPKQHGIPKGCFPCNQRLRMTGAIEQKIGPKIFRNVLCDCFDPVDHGIDDAVREPGHRHRHGIDDLFLRLPFCSNGVGDLPGRCDQSTRRGRADRLVIEGNGKATGRFDDAGMGVEALPTRPPRRAPHRLLRIKRRFSRHFIEQFTHYVFGFRRR